jgi:hypothetical protein
MCVIVAGSRNYDDYATFSGYISRMVERNKDKKILFISGAAKTGADRLIINYCKEHNLPCKEYPADWDNLGKGAGYARNVEMSKVATHLIAFWDGKSKGTEHMIDLAIKRRTSYYVVKI